MRTAATIFLLTLIAATWSNAQNITVVPAFPNLTFSSPVGLYNAGDGSNRLYVIEQKGIIRMFDNSPTVGSADVFLDITSRVTSGGELGLLGLAFDPDFAHNGTFYVDYTAGSPLRTVIARYHVNPSNPQIGDPASETVLLTISQPFPNHKGGQTVFGPDGYLYIGMGDGGSGGDPQGNGQNRTVLLGKILRLDVHDTAGGKQYGIPADNPFAGSTQFRPEIYAYGLRNPWRFSFDRSTGRLWVGDVGQDTWEEIDIVENGKDYGWNIMEGRHCYPPGTTNCDTAGLTLPIWEYGHDGNGGISISGGFVYRGSAIPSLQGKYIYGDYGSKRIWALTYDGTTATNEVLVESGLAISSFGIDKDSNLFVCAYDGHVYKLSAPSSVPNVADAGFALHGSTPNPAASAATIAYALGRHAHARLTVHDVMGREVATLIDADQDAGEHQATFNASGIPQGTYYCTLTSGSQVATARVMIVK